MARNLSFKTALLSVVSVLGVQAGLAHAQVETPPAEAEEDAVSRQDVVVVTVERREQSLQDYAGTAAAFSGEDLKLLGLQDFNDLDGKIPGLSVSNNQGNIEVYIRGVGSSNNTELGDPAAATHLNGVYVPRPSGFGAAFFDIQRVEVNVGPQGTLRGRNATAGSVDIIPWAPGIGNTDGMIEASVGNFNEYRLEGVANVAVTDNSAIRIAAFTMEHDSYLNNITPNGSTLGITVPASEDEGVGVAEAADDFGFRIGYAIEPFERLRATLTYDYIEQKGTGYTGVNFANPLGNGVRPEDIDNPRDVVGRAFTPIEDTEHWGLKLHLEYEFDGFSAEYIGSRRDLVYDYEFVTPAGPFYEGVFATLGPLDIDNFSRVRFITDSESDVHELRFFSTGEQKLDWTAGVFSFTEAQRTFLGTTGDRNPFFTGVEFNQTTDTESYSVYGDATFNVSDRFRLTGGLRYTEDKKERFGVNARYQFILGGSNFNCCFGTGVGTEGFQFAALDRTILNPDTDGNRMLSDAEILAFYFNGVKQFGARDGLDNIFANGVILGDAPPEARPLCSTILFTDPGGCFNTFVPAINGRVSFAVLGGNSIALQNGSLQNDFVDWRLRAEYDLSEDNLLYGLIATGNKSGGFNDNIPGTEGLGLASPAGSAPAAFDVDTLAPTYDQEALTLYEVGSKNVFDLNGMNTVFNASAFYYDYKDLQLFTLLSTAQVLDFEGITLTPQQLAQLGGNVVGFNFNASNAEIYGAQLEGEIDLPADWTLRATLLWLAEAKVVDSIPIQDARFQADVDPVNAVNRSIEGNRLPRTPEIQFNGSVTKAFDTEVGQFDGVVSFGYRSSQHLTIFNGIDYANPTNPALRLDDEVDGYWTFDAGAGYSPEEGNWRFEVYGANLTDVTEPQGLIITQFDNTRFFNRPRTYGARLRVTF
jgi:iron complex outermembrane receptor protein